MLRRANMRILGLILLAAGVAGCASAPKQTTLASISAAPARGYTMSQPVALETVSGSRIVGEICMTAAPSVAPPRGVAVEIITAAGKRETIEADLNGGPLIGQSVKCARYAAQTSAKLSAGDKVHVCALHGGSCADLTHG